MPSFSVRIARARGAQDAGGARAGRAEGGARGPDGVPAEGARRRAGGGAAARARPRARALGQVLAGPPAARPPEAQTGYTVHI